MGLLLVCISQARFIRSDSPLLGSLIWLGCSLLLSFLREVRGMLSKTCTGQQWKSSKAQPWDTCIAISAPACPTRLPGTNSDKSKSYKVAEA